MFRALPELVLVTTQPTSCSGGFPGARCVCVCYGNCAVLIQLRDLTSAGTFGTYCVC
jgi:hypothetical protein